MASFSYIVRLASALLFSLEIGMELSGKSCYNQTWGIWRVDRKWQPRNIMV